MLLERGILGYVAPLLLSYDATHAAGEQAQQTAAAAGPAAAAAAGAMPSADDAAAVLRLPLLRASAQATTNLQAQLAVRALAALAGYSPPAPAATGAEGAAAAVAPATLPATQPCPAAQRALAALLTETLAPRLGEPDPLPLLRDLNSTVQTPQVGTWGRHVETIVKGRLSKGRICQTGPHGLTCHPVCLCAIKG